jgi:hypothetical protein
MKKGLGRLIISCARIARKRNQTASQGTEKKHIFAACQGVYFQILIEISETFREFSAPVSILKIIFKLVRKISDSLIKIEFIALLAVSSIE